MMAPALSATDMALVALSVFAGAGTQRVTGLGFALVSAPFLVLVLGPFQGVLVANLLGLAVNLLVLAVTWDSVDVRQTLLLAIPAVGLVPLGAWVARELPAPALMVVIGSMILVALLAVMVSDGTRLLRGTTGAVTAGALSGFMNVTAGVGGPAVTLYALSTGWEHRSFVSSVQLYFSLLNAASLGLKGWPRLGAPEVVVTLGAVAAGVGAGQALARRVPARRARSAVIGLALFGAAATLAKGVASW